MGLKDEHAAKYDNQLREEESLLCCVRSSVVILFLLKSVEKNFIFRNGLPVNVVLQMWCVGINDRCWILDCKITQ